MSAGNGEAQIQIVLCAGQDCAERESCARYRVRGGQFRWASFDMDRKLPQYVDKPCTAHIEVRMRKDRH